MKKLASFLLVSGLVSLPMPANAPADGVFVAPKFVWDKHKDINEPTQKAIIVYDAEREDLILQVKYEGPVDKFGWLIPVPNLPTIQEGSMKCFYELSQYTQRHFEWPYHPSETRSAGRGNDTAVKSEPPVKVVEIKTVGAYRIAVLSTQDSGALAKWLEANRFYFPANKTNVLNDYITQHWYFIAAKINLSKRGGFELLSPQELENQPQASDSTALKLASGELNPLQISFASDRCVFPLKISSVNGQPSEVQVYVLSPEPLLEKTMLKKKLPLIYSNDMARAAMAAEQVARMRLMQRNLQRRLMGETTSPDSPLSPESEKGIQKIRETPVADADELPPYAKITPTDLPNTSQWVPRLADKSWWLTKQTWTLRPEGMRDLEFQPALPVFANELGTKYGYYAVESLARFQACAVPTLIAAMQDTNPVVRATTASIFNRGYGSINDPRLTEAAVGWLKDPEPEVRMAGVNVLTEYVNWNPRNAGSLVAMLRDKDARVRQAAIFALPRFRDDLENYIPTFEEMLKDKNPAIQGAGLEILQRLQVEVPREDLLPFFKSSDWQILDAAYALLREQQEKITDDVALVLLQNPQPVAQLLGLNILSQNPENQSIELALPLLQAPDEIVRLKATQTLRVLTGQQFTEDQVTDWENWWTKHKTNAVVQLHPEELRPQFAN